jgi:hypothetical protein
MTATDTALQGQTDGAYGKDIARAAVDSVHPVQEATVSTYSNMISE